MSEKEPSPDAPEESDAVDDGTVESGVETDGQSEGEERADPPQDLVERVVTDDPTEVAREIDSLRGTVEDLRGRLDERDERVEELESKLKHTQADFQNYKKRQERRRERQRRRATEDLVERLLDVHDNLRRALDAEGDPEAVREGVESTLRQFDRVLDEEDVVAIDPDPGDEVNPQRHEVLMRVDADQPGGTVAELHRPGYEMGEKVLRPAQVTVSEGGADGDGDGNESESEENGDDGEADEE